MKKGNKIILAILIIIAAVAIIVLAYYLLRPQSIIASCTVLENKVNMLINSSNYCNVDSDCVIVNQAYCGVGGFSCYKLFNKNADLSDINSEYGAFSKNCQPVCPELACISPPTQSDVACRNSICVDTRI